MKYQDLAGFECSVVLKIRHQLQMDVNSPPAHWQVMQNGTLVAHPREGEHRFDYIYYGDGEVLFLETTVSSYWDTKIPTTTQTGARKLASIQEKVAKWLGSDYYTVEVDNARLVARAVPMKKRKRTLTGSDDTADPVLPRLRYIVLTPRPSHDFNKARKIAYGFIGICNDTYLEASGLSKMEEIRSFALGGTEGME